MNGVSARVLSRLNIGSSVSRRRRNVMNRKNIGTKRRRKRNWPRLYRRRRCICLTTLQMNFFIYNILLGLICYLYTVHAFNPVRMLLH